MLQVLKIINSDRTAPFISFLIGMGVVVMLFHRPIITKAMLALPISKIENTVVRSNGKCYKYRAEDTACEIPH